MIKLLQKFTAKWKFPLFSSSQIFDRKTSIYIENLPSDWDEPKIKERFSVVGEIQKVLLIKNKLGISSGKAILQYETAEGASLTLKKFKTSMIAGNSLKVRPYINRAEENERKKLRLKISNVPYTITEDKIHELLDPFVQIDEIIFLYYPYFFILSNLIEILLKKNMHWYM